MACYFGYKNFSFKATIIGILISVGIVHLMFFISGRYLENKFGMDKSTAWKEKVKYEVKIEHKKEI